MLQSRYFFLSEILNFTGRCIIFLGLPATTTTYQTCSSCAGKGVLATTHQCTLCGSQVAGAQEVRLANQLSTLQLTSRPVIGVTPQSVPVAVTNQAPPVVIPVTNDKKAYLTQQTADGYLTQGVNVMETVDSNTQPVIG